MLRAFILSLPALVTAAMSHAEPLRSQFSPAERSQAQEMAQIQAEMAGFRMARSDMKGDPVLLARLPDLREARVPAGFERHVRHKMAFHTPDPESIELRDLRLFAENGDRHVVVCGEINARNIYGAHGGFDPFVLVIANPALGADLPHAANVGSSWISAGCDDMKMATAPTS